MKVTVVPAQVTTIEDRIAGNLGLSQLLLLAAPVFGGSALYAVLPPNMHYSVYKAVLMTLFLILCGLLSIRIKGKIILFWLAIILKYTLRPRYYVFSKNSLNGREQYLSVEIKEEEPEVKPAKATRRKLSLSGSDLVNLQSLIDNPAANLSFENKKGLLYVRITEVE